jgi:hypothetical protein
MIELKLNYVRQRGFYGVIEYVALKDLDDDLPTPRDNEADNDYCTVALITSKDFPILSKLLFRAHAHLIAY